MDRPSSDPAGKATFTAFGQDHTDAKALEAVRTQLETMQESLKRGGRKLVIAIERSQEQVLTDPRDIAELHNQGIIQAYFDDMHRSGETPSLDDFKRKHENELRSNARTLRTMTMADISWYRGKKAQEVLNARQAELIPRAYESCKVSARDANYADRGRSRVQEAAIYQFAKDNEIAICGLDPMSDEAKAHRLGTNTTQPGGSGIGVTVSTGKIDQTALEEMEYQRIQGMADKACQTMSELGKAGGGCVVAINMGSAHMASLEVAINDRTRNIDGLRNAEVTMCVLIKDADDEATAETKAKELMQMSAAEMRRCHERRLKKVQDKKETVDFLEVEVKGRNKRALHLKQQGPEVLAKKVEDPETLAKELCQDSSSGGPVTQGDQEEIKLAIEAAKRQFDKKKFPDITAALLAKFELDDESIKGFENNLADSRTELQQAQNELDEHRKVAEFSSRVEQRIAQPPKGAYLALAGNSKAGYRQGVRALATKAVDGNAEKPSQDEILPTSTANTGELTNSWADGNISESDANTILILSQNSPRNEKNSV